MAKNKDNLLGTGGQRGTVPRSELRGGRGGRSRGADQQAREHREELLRRIRERSGQRSERGPDRGSDDA